MRSSYVPTVSCPNCGTTIAYAPSSKPPEHLHLTKVSFVSPCPNKKCMRLVVSDPAEVRWQKVDLDDQTRETLPF